MSAIYSAAMQALLRGSSLSRQQAEATMDAMMEGALDHAQVAALLTALSAKGENADELTGFARAMRARCVPVPAPQPEALLDTCGTGGSGLSTANTSTMAAMVLAEAGVRVAKHGNRSSSGRCGSMDLLEALGANIDVGPDQALRLLGECNLALLFAPRYHPAVRHVMPVRKALGFRTAFNFLGPLCNPAGARRQLLGVSDPGRARLMAEALAELGTVHALVVWGEDGLDEISLAAPTRSWEVRADNGQPAQVVQGRITPEEMGLKQVPFAEFAGGDAEDNLAIFTRVLQGRDAGAHADHLALNVGAALYVADHAPSIAAGVRAAQEILRSGRAWTRFERYRELA